MAKSTSKAPTKLYRWVCPICESGTNAPSRPRMDDVRRYCLTCSAKTGRLVQRTAPALEKQRAERATSLTAKRQAKAQRAKEKETAYFTVAGVDLRTEMKKICRSPTLGGPDGWLAKRPPKLVIPRPSQRPRTRLGYAEPWRHRISVSAYPGIDAADARETLAHELVHIYLGHRRSNHQRGTQAWHDQHFHDTLREVMREVYGVTPLGAQVNSYHGRYARALREKEAA